MKPQARIQATVDILQNAIGSRVPLDTVVGDYMRHRRYIGSKDRANVAERVYEMARHHARIGWHLEKIGAQDTPRNRIIAWVMMGEQADQKRITSLFDGSKYSPEELTIDELKYCMNLENQPLTHHDMPLPVKIECPPQYEQSLRDYFGDEFENEMNALIPGATLDMRVNTARATREKAHDYLEADGVKTDFTPYSQTGLRARGKAYLAKTKAFGKGWVVIQDEGSQMIAHVCGAKPGMQVLDYCAGAGGKTLALAASMSDEEGNPKGRIVAMDLDERRLNRGKDRFKKARISDIVEMRPLSDQRHRKWLRRQKETFDIVLCDVPCTGTGTWRRNPDMRWNTYGPELAELVEIQSEIIEKVANVVKPGGKLVYATCSLLPEENEQQIEKFLSAHPEFEILPMPVILSDSEGSSAANKKSLATAQNDTIKNTEILGNPFMRLTPRRHQTDGFFAAVLNCL